MGGIGSYEKQREIGFDLRGQGRSSTLFKEAPGQAAELHRSSYLRVYILVRSSAEDLWLRRLASQSK